MPTTKVAEHALEILKHDDLWNWPETQPIHWHPSGDQSKVSQFERIAPQVLEQFWQQLGACDKRLEENVETLKREDFVSAEESFNALFRGLDPKYISFQPVLNMAAEYFTHLGVVFMNPGGRKSRSDTAPAVSEFVSKETETLLQELEEDGEFGTRTQGILQTLSHRRDGTSCLLTRFRFQPFFPRGVSPDLVHIIPNLMPNKLDTLRCISMFAGTDASKTITRQLSDLGNVMNMQTDAHYSYDALDWGIRAKRVVRYLFRVVPTTPDGLGPDIIALRDGDEILFGAGLEGGQLGKPNPELCNLRLAVAQVMKMSGAANIVLKWKEEADDGGWDGRLIASEEYCDMLDAKLFLSGRAVVV